MRAFATCALIGGALAVGLRSQVKNMLKAHTAGDSDVITGPIFWPMTKENSDYCLKEGTMLQYNKQYKDFEPCHNQGEACYIVVEPVYAGGQVVGANG